MASGVMNAMRQLLVATVDASLTVGFDESVDGVFQWWFVARCRL